MYKNTKRAERRHHYKRLKKRRQDLHYWGRGWEYSSQWTDRSLGGAVNTPCICSTCTGCMNPRKAGEKTLAEKRNDDYFDEQLQDLGAE